MSFDPADVMMKDDLAGEDQWNILRKVHFFINDLIVDALDAMGVSVAERRVLDALAYVDRFDAVEGVAAADLCDLMPSGMKIQSASSTLGRLEQVGLVESSVQGREDRTKDRSIWRITHKGHQKRFLYISSAERILREVYADAFDDDHQVNNFKLHQRRAARRFEAAQRFAIAMRHIDERYLPVLQLTHGSVCDDQRLERDMWAALRRTHFHVNDLIYREMEPIGIGPVERRVLDSLAFAYKAGAVDGIPVATICALTSRANSRQAVAMALERMSAGSPGSPGPNWVEQGEPLSTGRRRGRLWRLTSDGVRVRRNYSRYARHKIQETYELEQEDREELEQTGLRVDDGDSDVGAAVIDCDQCPVHGHRPSYDWSLFEVARSAERYRIRMLGPIVWGLVGEPSSP